MSTAPSANSTPFSNRDNSRRMKDRDADVTCRPLAIR